MHVFENESRGPSVPIAKERLKALIVTDRVQCKPDTYELLYKELYRTISKYMKVTENQFDVDITRSKISITLTGEES
ncbi:cell division topological specificity factor MinE [Bariatricus massiliensis]|uniref:Cell division topological specificity factor MinE n=1 Tax=Bariatricus massiliensis TaxID=1745713 RepID=A0ABS8DDK3_9FIRM|nr:cell division topological specificity factor MinE [Bariatricus massiliensis]MCB7303375.1 cell division topological specificity factor MinE [Bariatricus massiliensis]MCB7373507.1 cell division topological specificity factor MinE [Bariatricus massiliensis]MCB7386177.1 cell division topological specificity factor MinE [Bariatricus massiliensis]MCB7410339.1 cell division topological specificity factor MinE [Bariatricus massiliensis]MCQ5252377.1 cell division topological specificity factor MinE 